MTRLLAGASGPAAAAKLAALATAIEPVAEPFAVERLSESLAILVDEPSRGDDWQPAGLSGRPRCLLDGSLFNARELGAELGLPPDSDTEKLLDAAYRRHQLGMPTRLRGNFALLVYDPAGERILLACDQLGTRSIFFATDGEGLLFATEAQLLLRLLPTRPAPDESALIHWLAATSMPAGHTLYSGVERLGAGQLLSSDRGMVAVRRYWQPAYTEPAAISRAEAAAAARAQVEAAIGRQLPTEEKRCGVLLSGGLDSSSVAALGKRQVPKGTSIHAYSAVFPNHPSIDESELIEDAANGIGLERTSVIVRGGSMVRGALEYLQRWQLPLPAPNHFLWQPLLERAAADGTSLILDGEGGDELWKFSPYLLADLLVAARPAAALRATRGMLGDDLYRGWRSATPYLRAYGLKAAVPHSAHRLFRRLHDPRRYAPSWFTKSSAETLFRDQDPWTWKRFDGPRWWSYLADLLTGTRERLGVGDYMRHRAEMAGVDSLHPLIDLELVEFVLGLPPDLAIDPRLERPLLRDAMAGLIPDSIRLRPGKSYFTALFQDSLAERDFELVRDLLGAKAEVGAYVDLELVRRELLDEPAAGRRRGPAWPWSIWRLVTAECWLRSQGDDGFAERVRGECESRDDDWTLTVASA